MNRFFRPPRPLSDATRHAIYELFRKDEGYWTPRRLAEQFGISIDRVKACLRLKALEANIKADGKAVQTELCQGMERMLGARTIVYTEGKPAPESEPLRYSFGGAMTPFLRLMEEEDELSPKEAAMLLQKEPFNNYATKLDDRAENIVNPPRPGKMHVISESERLKSKSRFMIVDTSETVSQKIYVRDEQGKLRYADAVERWERRNVRPKKFKM